MRWMILIGFVLLQIGCVNAQSKCGTDFYDYLTKESGPVGNNICLPVIDSGKKKVLVVGLGILTSYLERDKHLTAIGAKDFIRRKLISNDTVAIDVLRYDWRSSIVAIEECKTLFGNASPLTVLKKYFGSKQENVLSHTADVAIQSKEAKLMIYYLFQHCIITYEDDESGALGVNLMYSKYRNMEFGEF